MTSYEDLGLNQYLRSTTSLPETQPEFRDFLEFDSTVERSSVGAVQLSGDAVGTSSLADNSVTTSKIAGSAVTNTRLASSSVDGRVIANSAVGSTEIGQNEIHGTHVADYNYAAGTGNLNAGGGTFNSGILGTPTVTGGIINNVTLGTPAITGGTHNSFTAGTPTIIRPTIDGTANFDINAGSAALGANGDFALQSFGSATVLVVRGGGTTFYFNPTGTI